MLEPEPFQTNHLDHSPSRGPRKEWDPKNSPSAKLEKAPLGKRTLSIASIPYLGPKAMIPIKCFPQAQPHPARPGLSSISPLI